MTTKICPWTLQFINSFIYLLGYNKSNIVIVFTLKAIFFKILKKFKSLIIFKKSGKIQIYF